MFLGVFSHFLVIITPFSSLAKMTPRYLPNYLAYNAHLLQRGSPDITLEACITLTPKIYNMLGEM